MPIDPRQRAASAAELSRLVLCVGMADDFRALRFLSLNGSSFAPIFLPVVAEPRARAKRSCDEQMSRLP